MSQCEICEKEIEPLYMDVCRSCWASSIAEGLHELDDLPGSLLLDIVERRWTLRGKASDRDEITIVENVGTHVLLERLKKVVRPDEIRTMHEFMDVIFTLDAGQIAGTDAFVMTRER